MTAVRPAVTTGLNVTLLIADGTVILSLSGAIDPSTAPILATHTASAMVAGARTLVIDMRRVTRFEPAGMAVLAHAQRTARPTRLVIVADVTACDRQIEGFGAQSVMPIYASLEDALEANRT